MYLKILIIIFYFEFVIKIDSYLPETTMNSFQIAEYYGYKTQQLTAFTVDGEKLTVVRILCEKCLKNDFKIKKPVIFFQHGLFSSSFDWMSNLPHESAAFYFVDVGYDVYLGNFRGNSYSPAKNWQFSIDEHAKYDLPAMIDLALSVSGQDSLYYVGHSQGSTTMFAKLSEDACFAKKIKKFFAVAPVLKISHVQGMFRDLGLSDLIYMILHTGWVVGGGRLFDNDGLIQALKQIVCFNFNADCRNVIFYMGGPYSQCMNETRMEIIANHDPEGSSIKNLYHWDQIYRRGKFAHFDDGSFGQAGPPEYDISKIQTDTYFFYSKNDYLTHPLDLQDEIWTKFNPNYIKYTQDLQIYNHFDYLWATNAVEKVYSKIHQIICNNC